MRVGSEIRKARSRLGLNQREYAERTGVPQQTLSYIESYIDADPRLSTVLALVKRGGLRLTDKGLRAD